MDDLRKKSDKELEKIEKKLTKIYKEAEKEISEKWNKFMEQAEKKLAPLEKAYADAKASGDEDLIHKTGFELGKAKKLQTVQNDRFKAMSEETAARLTNVNEVALDYVNGQMPKIYTMNYNETLGEIETEIDKVGVSRSFSLMDENTAKNLVKSDTSLFPQKVISKAKDEKWNLKAINSQVLQGLLQGESIDKISRRLQNVTDMNSAAATRNARTMCTTAENSGRLSGMKEAEEKGLVYEKQWMATHDGRTRESHQRLDGQTAKLDEPFGNDLMYPGDMNGDPTEVYNCRCSMVRKLIGFRRKDGSISEVGDIDSYDPDYFEKAETKQVAEEEAREEQRVQQPEPEQKEKKVSEDIDINSLSRDVKFDYLYTKEQGYTQNELYKEYEKFKDVQYDPTPEERYKLAKEMTKQVPTEDNFFKNSVGFWKKVDDREEKPNHISYNKRTGNISSEYWYTQEGVYRRSDHWGSDVASCSWYIEGREYGKYDVELGERETAFIPWNDLKAKGVIHYDEGVYTLNEYDHNFTFS